MDFSEEWKSLWPIASVYSAPLLIEQRTPPSSKRRRFEDDEEGIPEKSNPEIGPLIFLPCSESLVELFSSPALSPRLPPPYPALSLTRFLSTTATCLLPSTATCIASEFGPQLLETARNKTDDRSRDSYYLHGFNRLQLLLLSSGSSSNGEVHSVSVLAFFPTGENCDQVGYIRLYSKDGNLRLLVAKDKLNSRILKLLVNPVADLDDSLSGRASSSCFAIVGYLMACSMHSVHWYVVKTIKEHDGFQVKSAWPDFVGSKLFRSSAVVHACWSPHLCEESAVLLETGELYLFDLSSCLKKPLSSNKKVGQKKLQVLWDVNNKFDNNGGGCWLSCEFSWHPRILIVCHASAVFLVDARSEGCKVSCIMKIEMLSTMQDDSFTALSRAGSDEFSFCVASKSLLLLCDVRQPWRPLLQWVHNLDNPHYITVLQLSELRSKSKDEKYKWASESGSCILLGSFWDCEFSVFIYGPNKNRSIFSEISKFCNSFYAWGLPSEFSLSARDSNCGCCLMRDEFSRDSLPDWIDWRQKKDIVLGFGILSGDHVPHLSEPNNEGGFLLIRLMSSGKLEAQSYHAASEYHMIADEAHTDILLNSEDNLLYDTCYADYNLKKKFQHLELDYLEGYLKGNLAEILLKKVKKINKAVTQEEAEKVSSQKLETDGHTGLISLSRIFDVFKDINLPTSIHEISLRIIWGALMLAFSCQSRYTGVLKFLDISHHLAQFPFRIPSSYRSKLLHKTQASNDLADLFLPPQFLLTLHKLCIKELIDKGKLDRAKVDVLAADSEIKLQCDRIIEVAVKLISSSATDSELDDCRAISLSDDTDELGDGAENPRNLSFHEPVALLDEVSMDDIAPVKSVSQNKRFTNFIFKKHQELACNVDTEMVGLELLNSGCPLELKFGNSTISFGQKELKAFKLLKQQDLNFQKGFQLYQEYSNRSDLRKQGI